ncbi:MAG: hypothetical protein HQL07_14385 [Nitrospirae bacterium]|nr:hypothetical protein [Magnetococcales bacterium]HAT49281.1 hypothetical protein [Alphaproteobacteria bacterium]
MITPRHDQHTVRQFRQILLWPLQLIPLPEEETRSHWQFFDDICKDSPWQRHMTDGIDDTSEASQDTHYKEFSVFLPYVRRFLYGENRGPWIHGPDDPPGDAAVKRFHRHDISALRVVPRAGYPSVCLDVDGIELIFFDDIDLVLLKVEVSGTDLPLAVVLELLYRFGRAYPTGWNEDGLGIHNMVMAEWLGATGESLMTSDFEDRAKFLDFTKKHRVPATATHWSFLLRPMVFAVSDEAGMLRFHQIENHHMPKMAFLAIDNPRNLTWDQWLRLGMTDSLHPDEPIPKNDPDVIDFKRKFFFDRYWSDTDQGPNSRFICHGRTLLLIGDAQDSYFVNRKRGMLAQFRHQYFVVFLIAHFHRASLLIFSDRLVDAIHDFNVHQNHSVRIFRHRIHAYFEAFLRFTHRYWFHEVSERTDVQSLFRRVGTNLGNDTLYEDTKEELRDMSQYLDSDLQRRQSKTVTQLTVVTAFSLIGTLTTGALGMNILDETASSWWLRGGLLFITAIVSAAILLLTLVLSQGLWDFMESISDTRKSLRSRLRLIFNFRKNR